MKRNKREDGIAGKLDVYLQPIDLCTFNTLFLVLLLIRLYRIKKCHTQSTLPQVIIYDILG